MYQVYVNRKRMSEITDYWNKNNWIASQHHSVIQLGSLWLISGNVYRSRMKYISVQKCAHTKKQIWHLITNYSEAWAVCSRNMAQTHMHENTNQQREQRDIFSH